MRGAPARVIQELAGHADLRTMQRDMHLRASESATVGSVSEASRSWRHCGDGTYRDPSLLSVEPAKAGGPDVRELEPHGVMASAN